MSELFDVMKAITLAHCELMGYNRPQRPTDQLESGTDAEGAEGAGTDSRPPAQLEDAE